VSDVVISAPYGNEGGVIYIYSGSAGGIHEDPSQVVQSRFKSHSLHGIQHHG
jgi:hypothetical protein